MESKPKSLIQVVNLFKKLKPLNYDEIEAICKQSGRKLRYANSGCFRRTYRIGNLDLIVKIPINGYYYNIEHSVDEVKSVKRMSKLKKYKSVRKYSPKIYYDDPNTGIILMKRYTVNYRVSSAVVSFLQNIIEKHFPGNDLCSDVYAGNIGYEVDKRGRKRWKVIDLGLVSS